MLVSTFSNAHSWIEAALDELRAAAKAAREEGRASLALCLAGGLTPEGVYRSMAALPLGGLAAELWLGDERVVPAGDAARNGVMAARAFTGCVWEPTPRLRLWPDAETEGEAPAAAARYEAELLAALGPEPTFDLALMGLGADGHTASLFPGSPLLKEASDSTLRPRLTAVARSPVPPFARMTLTLGALRSARRRIFLVKGADKLPALRKLEAEDSSIPASLLAGPGSLVLYLG
ncbi:MAG: 6-phosphogluconolactonase [Rectinemataceae bacterium]|jgi:6-phosphogluconolactonase